MRRLVGNLFVWTCSILCATVLVLWGVSYRVGFYGPMLGDSSAMVCVNRGALVCWWITAIVNLKRLPMLGALYLSD